MKSQNIAIILLLSLISASFSTNQIVGGFGGFRLLIDRERHILKGCLQNMPTKFSKFLQEKFSII